MQLRIERAVELHFHWIHWPWVVRTLWSTGGPRARETMATVRDDGLSSGGSETSIGGEPRELLCCVGVQYISLVSYNRKLTEVGSMRRIHFVP